MSGKAPYPEHDHLVIALKNDPVIWHEILESEKDILKRNNSLKFLKGMELYDQIEYLESLSTSSAVVNATKIAEEQGRRGVTLMEHEIIFCIRFHARSDLGFEH